MRHLWQLICLFAVTLPKRLLKRDDQWNKEAGWQRMSCRVVFTAVCLYKGFSILCQWCAGYFCRRTILVHITSTWPGKTRIYHFYLLTWTQCFKWAGTHPYSVPPLPNIALERTATSPCAQNVLLAYRYAHLDICFNRGFNPLPALPLFRAPFIMHAS